MDAPSPPAATAAQPPAASPLAGLLSRSVRERTLQRFAALNTDDPTYPTRWEYRALWSDRQAALGELFFTHQTTVDDRYFGAHRAPNLVRTARANLLVADAGDIAIEATAGEPKVFFATTQVVSRGNAALRGEVRLRQTNRYLWVTRGGTSRKLYETEPVVASARQQGLGVRTPQRCNEMATFVSGKYGLETDATKQANQLMADTLTAVTGDDQWRGGIRAGFATHEELRLYGEFLDRLVLEFQRVKDDPVLGPQLETALTARLANTALDPQLGAAISTLGVATAAQERAARQGGADVFSYHFATVVAKSGSDYVTLENYARRDPEVTDTLSGGDPLYFFRMYGRGTPGVTFHERQVATGAFLGATLSIQVA